MDLGAYMFQQTDDYRTAGNQNFRKVALTVSSLKLKLYYFMILDWILHALHTRKPANTLGVGIQIFKYPWVTHPLFQRKKTTNRCSLICIIKKKNAM